MARAYKPKIALNKLPESPLVNPLIEPQEIRIQRRYVRTAASHDLVNPGTGITMAVAQIKTVEERDDAEFVKVFADGVKAAFGLSRTGSRVFQAVLAVYQTTAMRGGFAEAVELFWFGEGLRGEDIGMSNETFKKGLRELIEKSFLALRNGNTYWVNPALFFKGDRVAFVREYQRKQRPASIDGDPHTVDLLTGQQDLPL